MLAYERSEKRVPYRPSIDEMFITALDGPVKPRLPKYWSPLFCKHCGSAVFELVEPTI